MLEILLKCGYLLLMNALIFLLVRSSSVNLGIQSLFFAEPMQEGDEPSEMLSSSRLKS